MRDPRLQVLRICLSVIGFFCQVQFVYSITNQLVKLAGALISRKNACLQHCSANSTGGSFTQTQANIIPSVEGFLTSIKITIIFYVLGIFSFFIFYNCAWFAQRKTPKQRNRQPLLKHLEND